MSATDVIENSKDTRLDSSQAGKYLSFILGNEEYGIEILSVREIITVIEITTIPNVPEFIQGVINLRGNVIPVIDLRLKFGMPHKEHDRETCIIVVNVEKMLMGILVDTVSEVLDIQEDEIDDAPSFGASVETDFIHGMGKMKDKVIILLNIEKVLQSEQLAEIKSLAGDLNETEEINNV